MTEEQSAKPSRFLSLPPELRNEVYTAFFSDGKPSNLRFLQTCKQIYSEANILACSMTYFEVSSIYSPVMDRLSLLNTEQKNAIQNVVRQVWDHHDFFSIQLVLYTGIQPTKITLRIVPQGNPEDMWFDWLCTLSRGSRREQLHNVMKLATFNPKRKELVLRTEYPHILFAPEDDLAVDDVVSQYKASLEDVEDEGDEVEWVKMEETGRGQCGLTSAKISYKPSCGYVPRAFEIFWERVFI